MTRMIWAPSSNRARATPRLSLWSGCALATLLLLRGDGEGGLVVDADGVGEDGGEPLVVLVVGGVALVIVVVVGGAVP